VQVPVAARCKAWVCCHSLTGFVCSNPTGRMDVCCECCVLSGRGLCVGLIIRPEESYRLWCVSVISDFCYEESQTDCALSDHEKYLFAYVFAVWTVNFLTMSNRPTCASLIQRIGA
jgi:hypothetical protein